MGSKLRAMAAQAISGSGNSATTGTQSVSVIKRRMSTVQAIPYMASIIPAIHPEVAFS
jgi:hypothetical protein